MADESRRMAALVWHVRRRTPHAGHPDARCRTGKRPALGRASERDWHGGPRRVVLAGGYFAAFREVRRQRVHTSDFVSFPFASRVVKGWRFGW
jgi:hypothetical protein